jgi:cell division control protein 24
MKADLRTSIDLLDWILKIANNAFDEKDRELAVAQLKKRVNDWRGHDLNRFGGLLLFGTFRVFQREPGHPGRDNVSYFPLSCDATHLPKFSVYLFESILVFCKERTAGLSQQASDRPSLRFKGWVFLASIIAIEAGYSISGCSEAARFCAESNNA